MWYPAWALRRSDVSHDTPAQAVAEDGRVVARNQLAARAGVENGMRRRAAEAVCPTVVTIVQDLTAEMVRFEPVIDAVVAELAPIRERAEALVEDPDVVRSIIADGCDEARDVARETLDDVRQAMGLDYR